MPTLVEEKNYVLSTKIVPCSKNLNFQICKITCKTHQDISMDVGVSHLWLLYQTNELNKKQHKWIDKSQV